MRSPCIIRIDNLKNYNDTQHKTKNGEWVPARPVGFPSIKQRLLATWLVFTGKADALLWKNYKRS